MDSVPLLFAALLAFSSWETISPFSFDLFSYDDDSVEANATQAGNRTSSPSCQAIDSLVGYLDLEDVIQFITDPFNLYPDQPEVNLTTTPAPPPYPYQG